MAILSDRVTSPAIQSKSSRLCAPATHRKYFLQMMPADTFYLAAEFQRKYPEQTGAWGSGNAGTARALSSASRTGQLEALVARFW